MKRADLIRHLEANRCFFVREGSKHTVYRNSANGYLTTVPRSSHVIYRTDPSMKIIARSMLVVIALVVASPVVRACSCVVPEVQQAFEQARMVFVGEVMEIVPPRSTDKDALFADRVHSITFRVETTWKGLFSTEAKVFAPMGDCFSIQPLRVGEKYLVYATPVVTSGNRNDVMINGCNRTARILTSPPTSHFFSDLFGRDTAKDIRILNNIFMMTRPSPKRDLIPFMTFLDH